MKNILAPAQRDLLRQFAASNVLLAFDYDGTLAPIVIDHDRAFIANRTRQLLQQATRLYPTIVISGRAQPDALRRLRGLGVYEVVGNHGLEPWNGRTDHLIAAVRRWLEVLQQQLPALPGIDIEDKIFSLAVHYRRAREKSKARGLILRLAARLQGARVMIGKQVVNIVPEEAPHKGTALQRERQRLRCDKAIYVGDDQTDEDVFAVDRPENLLAIRVGQKRQSAAPFYIARQSDIDLLLRVLVQERRKSA